MPNQQFANSATSTLNGGITNVATSMVVTSATPFPTVPEFPVRFADNGEIVLVTAVAGTTFTIVRAQEGTSATSHSNGVVVTSTLTAQALRNSTRFLSQARWGID